MHCELDDHIYKQSWLYKAIATATCITNTSILIAIVFAKHTRAKERHANSTTTFAKQLHRQDKKCSLYTGTIGHIGQAAHIQETSAEVCMHTVEYSYNNTSSSAKGLEAVLPGTIAATPASSHPHPIAVLKLVEGIPPSEPAHFASDHPLHSLSVDLYCAAIAGVVCS